MTDIDVTEACKRAADVLGLDDSARASLKARPIDGGWRVRRPQTGDGFGASELLVRASDGKTQRVSMAVSDDRAARILREMV